MSTTIHVLEKTVNSGLTTNVKRSEINFNQLFIDVDVEDIISTILFNSFNLPILSLPLSCDKLSTPKNGLSPSKSSFLSDTCNTFLFFCFS